MHCIEHVTSRISCIKPSMFADFEAFSLHRPNSDHSCIRLASNSVNVACKLITNIAVPRALEPTSFSLLECS